MRRRSPLRGLGPFLEALDGRLRSLAPEDVRAALLTHAAALAPSERDGFLAIFGDRASADGPTDEPDPLLADIEVFVADLGSGKYYAGWGWDQDIHEERAFGDESWAEEMDDLFSQAGSVFLDGDFELAREVYGRLLHAFLLEEDGEVFSGQLPASDMVRTDVTEAKARYLRALYETTPPPERTTRLADAVTALVYVGGDASLQAMAETRRDPLPDLPMFLPAWIQHLRGVPEGSWPFGQQAKRLLMEAVELEGGVDGLGTLARERSDPELFLSWVDALLRERRNEDAAAAAREALTVIGPRSEERARIAERLALLDPGAVVTCRREAWRASPSRGRLLRLWTDAEAEGAADEVLAEEAEAARSARRSSGGMRPRPSRRLLCEALLLAGKVGEAITILKRADKLAWSDGDHPGSVVVPYLLVAATCDSHPDLDSILCEVFDGINTAPRSWEWTSDEDGRPETPLLTAILAGRLERLPHSASQRAGWLATAVAAVEARTETVVKGQHRGAYQRVAQLVAGCAEAIALANGEEQGEAFVEAIRSRYPRHSAFKRELDRIFA